MFITQAGEVFLGASAYMQKALITFINPSVCLFFCMYQLIFHWLDFCAMFYSRILQSVEKFKIWLQWDKNIQNCMWGQSTVYSC
jgi:hypothetical protein